MAFQPSVQALSRTAGAASGPPPVYSRDALIASLFGRGPIGSSSLDQARQNYLQSYDVEGGQPTWEQMYATLNAKSDADLLGSATAHQQGLASDLEGDFGSNVFAPAVNIGALSLAGAGVGGSIFGAEAGASGAEAGTASMPPAIPEPDPTFGGTLTQTAPGVFGTAAAGAETLGAAAGPPIPPPGSVDLTTIPPAYAGLPPGDPAAPGVYSGSGGYPGEPTGQYGGPTGMPLPSDNPLDWLQQLSRTASPYLNLASAGLGLYSASRAGKTPSPAPVYDPFASQRGQYQQQLLKLSTDPNYLTQLPGYKAGIEATRRGMAAGGYNLSGNEEAALFNYGGNIYNQEATRLANLAGANVGPMVSGASPSNVAQADLVSRSLASLGYAARSFAAGG